MPAIPSSSFPPRTLKPFVSFGLPVVLALVLALPRFGWSQGLRLGAEFQVNTYTTGGQSSPAVAAAADGDFVVVWSSYGGDGQDGSLPEVFGRRYTSAGAPVGGEFQVNTYTTGSQYSPAVAAAADGDFVVVWNSGSYDSSYGQDGSLSGVFGQRFAFSGETTTTSSTTTTSTSTTSSTSGSSSTTTTSSLPATTTTVTASTSTTTTVTASTTTSTLASLSTFLGRLSDALPDPDSAGDKQSRNAAKKLGKLDSKASTKIGKCTDASGNKQQKLCKKARAALNKLLNAARKANDKGTLGVELDPIDQAVTGALKLLPA